MTTQQDYLMKTPMLDEDGYVTEHWTLMRAYVRLASSGTIKLERFNARNKAERSYKTRTNHENDRWLINELAEAGLLRVHYAPATIDLFPSRDGVNWLGEIEKLEDTILAKPRPAPKAYADNPMMGVL